MSVFADEWRACLREQYKRVIREQDETTRHSLTHVLVGDIGFSEEELAQLRVETTMRVEDNPEDFIPDLEILQPAVIEEEFQPHPLECQCPACVEINLQPHNDEGQPIVDEDALQEYYEEHQNDSDSPQQLSMF